MINASGEKSHFHQLNLQNFSPNKNFLLYNTNDYECDSVYRHGYRHSWYHTLLWLSWQMSLLGVIDNSGSECLNESDSHPFQHALNASTDQYLESDCDEQLIIVLAFQQPIKLHSIQLVGPTDGTYACIELTYVGVIS